MKFSWILLTIFPKKQFDTCQKRCNGYFIIYSQTVWSRRIFFKIWFPTSLFSVFNPVIKVFYPLIKVFLKAFWGTFWQMLNLLDLFLSKSGNFFFCHQWVLKINLRNSFDTYLWKRTNLTVLILSKCNHIVYKITRYDFK